MTLLVGLRGADGLVLATDSRGTVGDPRGLTAINDIQEKMFQLAPRCGVGVSGSSEVGAKLIDELKSRNPNLWDADIEGVVAAARSTARNLYEDWFGKFDVSDRPGLGLLFAGYRKIDDGEEDEPRLYLLSSRMDFAPQLFPTGMAMVGVVQYAVYLAHRFYKPDLPVERVAHLAAFLISETATQDPKVGGPIKIATLTAADGFERIPEKRVKEIKDSNDRQSHSMREFFAEGESPHSGGDDNGDG